MFRWEADMKLYSPQVRQLYASQLNSELTETVRRGIGRAIGAKLNVDVGVCIIWKCKLNFECHCMFKLGVAVPIV